MNIDAYNHIIETIDPVLKQKNFVAVDKEDGSYFANETAAVKVEFNEDKNLFVLKQCALTPDGEPSDDWSTLSSWLFLPDYDAKEARSIATDFSDTLKEVFGLKPKTVQNKASLPEKPAGDVHNITSLSARFLTIFPQFKDVYASYTTDTGAFLYVKFFSEIGATHLKELLKANDKKRLEKYFDALNIHYCLGDKDVRAVISSVILTEAIGNDEQLKETAYTYLADYNYLKIAADFSLKINKKGLSK